MSKVPRLTFALLVVFVLSGFAGLIYQSVWTQYLGLTLGHAAYAQTLVLAIFMGGMAMGAWLASLYSVLWKRLILGYALVELLIGLCGLVFHPLFVVYTGFSQETMLPALDSVVLARGYQWVTAALLIAPQSVLLGATFPLMSAGLIRALPGQHGEVLGGLYFTNSLGAALGALLSTFVLLPAVGLPGTVLTAGILNVLVALMAWGLSKSLHEETYAPLPADDTPASDQVAAAEGSGDVVRLGRILVWSTAVSGAASFVYEVGWVRMLNQALGATIHSFELMLAAFILGLAFGGLWIRHRAKSILLPVRYVGYVQVWMAVAALLSIPVFTQSFHWVGWIMSALSRSETGYVIYELATGAISLLVMFPAAFLAGMTLPLFTLALMRAGAGERSIGRIYAANTLGAIVGVAATMHLLIPLLGVRLAVTFGAVLDGLVGLYLLLIVKAPAATGPAMPSRWLPAAAAALAVALCFSIALGKPDPLQQVAGVFRTGLASLEGDIRYLRDGKTATVGVITLAGGTTLIATNGKPDAGLKPLNMSPSPDEITMTMLGMLPLALHPDHERIAVIGWGSGMSTHTLLGSDVPRVVDTIEIERAMVDGARVFGNRVARAYTDPRSNLHIDDARTFFSTGGRRYDAIISEPSNPWVSGVASLFTQEFYGFLRRHLERDGMLVQWLHAYEIDDQLVGTMLAALLEEFPFADVYITNSSDMVIVARTQPGPHVPVRAPRVGDPLAAELRRVGLDRPEHYSLRHLGSERILRNLVRVLGSRPHSDYFPVVSLTAPKTRFMGRQATYLMQMANNGLPVLDVLDCRRPLGRAAGLAPIPDSVLSEWHHTARVAALSAAAGDALPELRRSEPALVSILQSLKTDSALLKSNPGVLLDWSENVGVLARSTIGHLPPEDLVGAWQHPGWLDPSVLELPAVRSLMYAYQAAARRDTAAMRATAQTVLARPEDELGASVREQMLILAMLGALGEGDAAAVSALDQRWSATVGTQMLNVRAYLLAWADSGVPACMSRDRNQAAAEAQ